VSAEESFRAFRLRTVKDVSRFALLDDLAVVHEDQMIADVACELHLVRDDEHRHSIMSEVAHDDEDFADELRIEART
jgi:hypothetical protein